MTIRMEDPDEEWRIQECSTTDKHNGRLSRIWLGGLRLGKQVALTGIVVSAALLVLPPLVVFSAFGVAVSVHLGCFLASYSVTGKLMSTLLPKPELPPPPLLVLQCKDVSSDVAEEEANEYDDEKVKEEDYEEDDDLQEEDDAFKVRIGLDEEANDEIGFTRVLCNPSRIEEVIKDIGEVIVDTAEQDGYEEDTSEYLEKEELTHRVVSEVDGECIIAEQVEFGDVEPKELEKETKGMIESIRDEGKTETESSAYQSEEVSSFITLERDRDIGEIDKFLVPSEKETADGLVNMQNDVQPVESEREISILELISDEYTAKDKDMQHSPNLEKLKLLPEETAEVIAGLQKFSEPVTNHAIGLKGDGDGVSAMEEQHVCERKIAVRVKKSGDHKATDIREETDLNARGETLIFTTAETATKSGLDLLGQDDAMQDRCTRSADGHPEGIALNSSDIPATDLDNKELSYLHGVLASTPAKLALLHESTLVEGLKSREDNIWKQINAMRSIVGYKAEPQASCVEELKALYLFMGIEPPTSINEPTSIADIDEKLQFLMAIVGVKK